jgi:hypothetical protein
MQETYSWLVKISLNILAAFLESKIITNNRKAAIIIPYIAPPFNFVNQYGNKCKKSRAISCDISHIYYKL